MDTKSKILNQRYLARDQFGKVIETPEQMFRRVADTIAAVEDKYGATKEQIKEISDKFYEIMSNSIFLPNSPTLMCAGRKLGMLSACFVLPIEDNINSIFDTVKHTALIHRAGGGTGFSLDRLRPTGDNVSSSGGKTSGPLSFLKVISEGSKAIQQGAFRRGANMGMMSIWHPDILRFIYAKKDPTAFTNFNFSVKVTDAFMHQLTNEPNSLHVVVNQRTKKRYNIPHSINVDTYILDDLLLENQTNRDCYTAKEVWNLIVENAWASGEPGICFIDKVNRDNFTPQLGEIESCNPCSEAPLLPYEACNLGSINISKFITEDSKDLDWEHLKAVIKIAIRFLDNVIDANHFPIPEIEKAAKKTRKIGLGIMGFADALIMLGMVYGSEESIDFTEKLASFVQKWSHKFSEELAKERGVFPCWKGSLWDTKYHKEMRNATTTTIAPTGSISFIAGCSAGIEPLYAIVLKRRILDDELIEIHPAVVEIGKKEGWLDEVILEQLKKGILLHNIPKFSKKLTKVLVLAHDIASEDHIKIQAAFQEHVDTAISKTINLPSTSTIRDVDKAYKLAYKLGCKGITVYRDGCRKDQTMEVVGSKLSKSKTEYKSRKRTVNGTTTKFHIGCGTLYTIVNKDEKGICEVFSNLGKAGGCPAQSEATCRIVSIALRCGVSPELIVEQLNGIRCLSTISKRKKEDNIEVLSCPDAIAKAIKEAIGKIEIEKEDILRCPECGTELRFTAGCEMCLNCGYSKCG